MVQKMRKMKDSGIEWIGEIPEGWEVVPVKRLCTMQAGKNLTSEQIAPEGTYPVYGGNGIRGFFSDYNCDGQFLTVGRQGALCGNVHKINGKVWATEHAVITTPSSYAILDFLYYLLIGMDLNQYVSSTAAQPGLAVGTLLNLKTCYPCSTLEQTQISNYLNAKCSEINIMLSKTRSSIEEYKKLKQAVITQAVTKGVRGEREMKDSGVEWIGEIPVEWEISRIKYVSIFEPSCDFRKLTPETIITYSPMECIKNGTFERRTSLYGNLAHTLTPFQDGDIVMAKVTPCFENGNIAIMNELQSGYGLGSSELFVFRPQNINTKYLFYWLQNKLFVHQACATMTGTGGLKRISPSFVKNCNIHYPAAAEQAEIADYLDAKCAEIDGLIAKKEQLVKELESYKKSLIYEVVTGKREV